MTRVQIAGDGASYLERKVDPHDLRCVINRATANPYPDNGETVVDALKREAEPYGRRMAEAALSLAARVMAPDFYGAPEELLNGLRFRDVAYALWQKDDVKRELANV